MAFRIDNKDPLYKKLIKLPAAYYTLKEDNNGNGYTIDSHIGTAKVENTRDLKLRKDGNRIVLYKGNLPLQLNGQDCVIEQGDIIGTNKVNIIQSLQRKEVDVVPQYIPK